VAATGGSTERRRADALAAVSVALAAAATVVLAIVGGGRTETETYGPDGVVRRTVEETDEGYFLYGVGVTAVVALGLLVRRSRPLVAVAVVGFSMLAALSVGGFFLPSGIAMVAAALLTPRERAGRAG
jgi:hypothetical protein